MAPYYPADDAKLGGALNALGQLMRKYSGQLIARANDTLERELGLLERDEQVREASMSTTTPTYADLLAAIEKQAETLKQLQQLAADVKKSETVVNRQLSHVQKGDDNIERLMISVPLFGGDSDGMIARSQGTSYTTGKPQHTVYIPDVVNEKGQVLGYTLTVVWCDVDAKREYAKRDTQYWQGRRKG